MKPRLMTALIVVRFILGAWQLGRAQAPVAQFQVTVERTDTGVTLVCSQGCAWATLSFSLDTNASQAVDEMGMAKQ